MVATTMGLALAQVPQPKDKAQIVNATQSGELGSVRVYSLTIRNLDGQYSLGNLALKFTMENGLTAQATPNLKPIAPGKYWTSQDVRVSYNESPEEAKVRHRFNLEVTSASYFRPEGPPGF